MGNKSFAGWLFHCIAKVKSFAEQLVVLSGISKTTVKAQIDLASVPEHIAIIMDGNGRWATRRAKPRVVGHSNAILAIKEAVEGCIELKVPYLTLFAFSMENWQRPQKEVNHLMKLITQVAAQELTELAQKQVRVTFLGDLGQLPLDCQDAVREVQETTKHCQGLHLSIALSYSGRWDVLEAVKGVIHDIKSGQLMPQSLDAHLFSKYLSTREVPDPALLIRTSGEMRLSNFLLWQSAYTELFFTPVLWPDFRKQHLYKAVMTYQKRDRRFGKKLGL